MDEFADVVFVTFRLARFMDIDIETALENKMKKVKERVETK
jgi:NTP pyrophosphatase (non-canonical NTP hydrolase)